MHFQLELKPLALDLRPMLAGGGNLPSCLAAVELQIQIQRYKLWNLLWTFGSYDNSSSMFFHGTRFNFKG